MADDLNGNDDLDGPVDAGPPRPKGEGVRIIGAEEAAAALESGTVSPRQPDDAPRYGDRPAPPDTSRARGKDITPILSARSRPSPWGTSDDDGDPDLDRPDLDRPAPDSPPPGRSGPGLRERLRQRRPDDDVGSTQPIDLSAGGSGGQAGGSGGLSGGVPVLPHWTEPPTGEVPRILVGADDEAGSSGAGSSGAGSSAAGDPSGPRWRDQDADWADSDFGDIANLVDDRDPADDPYRSNDLADHDAELEAGSAGRPVDTQPRPAPAPTPGPTPQWRPEEPAGPQGPPAPRNVPVAVATGVAFGIFALLIFRAGPGPALALAVAVVGLAAIELFAALRRAGYRPATLLGITSTVSVMLAAYAKGETAIPLVLCLTMVCALLWFMFGVVRARPTMNVGVTLLGVIWVGFLGSFAALLLRAPERRGIAFLLGAIIATVAYDVGAMVVGARSGRTPLAPEISPNKTWEGIMGGAGAALLASVLIVGRIHPWDLGSSLALGLVIAFMAPLGDLSQSLIKRDLGMKDMGTLLPGHGGVMDRFDALLFVLPATYYLVRLLQLA